MPDSKKRFFQGTANGGAKLDLNYLRFYTKIENNAMHILGLEMDELEVMTFKTEAEAAKFEKEWWLNLNNVVDYNNRYLLRTYSGNPGKYKMLQAELQSNLKRFYNQYKNEGYYF